MRILFTGASSFTGLWFVKELIRLGHDVTATLTRSSPEEYADDGRGKRVQLLRENCRLVFGVRFGDERFLALIAETKPDLLCHHAAEVNNYKSADFDVPAALANNTRNLTCVLAALSACGCNRIVLTGSLFEGAEGAGSGELEHFSPYGLSKALTAAAFRYYSHLSGFSLGKFVIPNPFGPHEEPRFTAYLVRCWQAGEVAVVMTPAYVRDNIHVSLLARHYGAFIQSLSSDSSYQKTNPSGYIETQGAFAHRFAREVGGRLGMECPIRCEHQINFAEPRIRINTDPPDAEVLGWNEAAAWDELCDFYIASRRNSCRKER